MIFGKIKFYISIILLIKFALKVKYPVLTSHKNLDLKMIKRNNYRKLSLCINIGFTDFNK